MPLLAEIPTFPYQTTTFEVLLAHLHPWWLPKTESTAAWVKNLNADDITQQHGHLGLPPSQFRRRGCEVLRIRLINHCITVGQYCEYRISWRTYNKLQHLPYTSIEKRKYPHRPRWSFAVWHGAAALYYATLFISSHQFLLSLVAVAVSAGLLASCLVRWWRSVLVNERKISRP